MSEPSASRRDTLAFHSAQDAEAFRQDAMRLSAASNAPAARLPARCDTDLRSPASWVSSLAVVAGRVDRTESP